MTEVPPRPPRHTTPPQNTYSGGSGGGRGPLPPLPQQQQPVVPTPQPRPPPIASRTARPQSASGGSYSRNDSGHFGPGKQEKEVRTLYNTYRNYILPVRHIIVVVSSR